jgi:ABC-2 type transport system permease protein
MRAWRLLISAELKTVVRDTAGLIIPLCLPLLILVMNALNVEPDVLTQYVLPLVMTIVIATVGMVNTPSFLATYRKTGVLRRLAMTPVHPSAVLGAQLVAGSLQVLAGVLLAVVIAVAVFGAALPVTLWLTVAIILLVTVMMFAIGLVVAALAPSANAALAFGLVAFFGLSAVGGMFGPLATLPAGVARVGEILPFGAANRAISDAWTGAALDGGNLLSLAVTTVVCVLLAVRFFRWT